VCTLLVPRVLAESLEGEVVEIVSGGVSDVGRVRTNNEDSYKILDSLNLYVLSDGMGGEAHGEVASALAVDTVVKHCTEANQDSDLTMLGGPSDNFGGNTKRLQSAVRQANLNIFESAQNNPAQRGMGATVTAVWANQEKLSVAHVGDSRAYLLRTGTLQQLTSDHSLVAEQVRRGIITPQQAEESEMQSVLLRALGAHPDVEVDVDEVGVYPGDILLICSDGLTRMVTEPEIAGTLQAENRPANAAQRLVDLANENGGLDNVTVIVVRFQEQAKSWFSWLRRGAAKQD
jgi:serine/threonine protein phosphatase PrpC